MQAEDWSGGGQDSAYFSQHSTMTELETPGKERRGWSVNQTVCNHLPLCSGAGGEEEISVSRRMTLPSSSCWSGLERKLFWFTENKTDFFKKFRLTNTRHRPAVESCEDQPDLSATGQEQGRDVETENIDDDLLKMKVLLVRLKSVLSQVRPEEDVYERSSLAKENELLKKELKLLKISIRERDTKIKNLENLLSYENELYSNSFTDWSIN